MEPILVIMAAGMGSRYGGPKQIDPITSEGDIIMDFSLYDAYQAGFRRVAFIIKENFETKGGTLYLILNKRLPSYLRNSIKNTLLDIRANGVELTIDFKYKVQTANYISGGAFVGIKRILHITDSFYDEISQIKNFETNLARINLITQEGVR